MTYCHLSQYERYQIEAQRQSGLSVAQIALRLGRHRSSIYRELKRCGQHYKACVAQRRRQRCARQSCANAPRYASAAWTAVRQQLRRQWSPQQVAGRARHQGRKLPCWQAIYGWIRRCWPARLDRPLRRALRRGGYRSWAHGATPIGQRPRSIQLRQELGHWESDTMVGVRGGHQPRLLVSVERASRYTRLSLLPDAMPWTVARYLQRDVLASANWPVHSVTVDRGVEFAALPRILGPQQLFVCDPQRPNQRGTNENTIGLVRQYIPKGQPLSLQTRQSIARIERLLNDRPRACLGFKTPAEVLSEMYHRCRDSK